MPALIGLAGLGFAVVITGYVLYVLAHTTGAWFRSWAGRIFTATPAGSSRSFPTTFLKGKWKYIDITYDIELGLTKLEGVVSNTLGGALKSVEHWVVSALTHAVLPHLRPMTTFLRGMETIAAQQALHIKGLAAATYDALNHLTHVTVPAIATDIVAPVRAIAIDARTLARDAEARIDTARIALLGALAAAGIGSFSTLAQGLTALTNFAARLYRTVYTNVIPRLDRLYDVVIPRLTRDLDGIFRDLYETGLESLAGLRIRMRRIEDFLGGALADPLAWIIGILGTAAGLLALEGVLARVAPNLFCNNTKGVTKKLCGLDETMLAGLLAGALGLLVALDVEKIAREAQDAYGAVDGLVHTMAGR